MADEMTTPIHENSQKLFEDILRQLKFLNFVGWKRTEMRRSRYPLTMACITVLLAMSSACKTEAEPQQTPLKDIYAAHYQPFTPSSSTSKDPAIKQAIDTYKRGEYVNALEQFATIDASRPSDTTAFYIALTALELNDLETAISRLRPLSLNAHTVYKEHATWYLALTYVRQKNYGRTLGVLNKLSAFPGQLYYEESRTLVVAIRLALSKADTPGE